MKKNKGIHKYLNKKQCENLLMDLFKENKINIGKKIH